MTLHNAFVTVRPMSAHTGAEVLGVDLAQPMLEPTFLEVQQALHDWGVIFFRDQDITPEQQLAFAERFGALDPDSNLPKVGGSPFIREIRKEPDETRNVGGNWHSDHAYDDLPPLGSILMARELPPSGGDTLFAHMSAAYDTLSDGLKATLATMNAVHAKSNSVVAETPIERRVSTESSADYKSKHAAERAIHPVIARHPGSGRRVLFVNHNYTERFEGWTREESLPLLNYLIAQATRPEHTCRFRWEEGSIAFWDNRAVMHLALNDYHGHRRLMHRVTIKGPWLEECRLP